MPGLPQCEKISFVQLNFKSANLTLNAEKKETKLVTIP